VTEVSGTFQYSFQNGIKSYSHRLSISPSMQLSIVSKLDHVFEVFGLRSSVFKTPNYEHCPAVSEETRRLRKMNVILKQSIWFRSMWSESDCWPDTQPLCVSQSRARATREISTQQLASTSCYRLGNCLRFRSLLLYDLSTVESKGFTCVCEELHYMKISKTKNKKKNYQPLPGPCWNKTSTRTAQHARTARKRRSNRLCSRFLLLFFPNKRARKRTLKESSSLQLQMSTGY
jgi:hypothetical protein